MTSTNVGEAMEVWVEPHPDQEGSSDSPDDMQHECSTSIVAPFDPESEGKGGANLENCVIADPIEHAMDQVAGVKLWRLSRTLLRECFSC